MIYERNKKQKTCTKCKPSHKVSALKDDTEGNPTSKVNLLSCDDKRMLFQKSNECFQVFDSSNLLLNPLHFQCPICGSLISLGHFNDFLQKGDKVFQHLKSAHYEDTKSNAKGVAFILMKRHEDFPYKIK